MWSLPDINAMNEEAAKGTFQTNLEMVQREGLVECHYCENMAVNPELYYDIFSNDPKGVVGVCEECEEKYGSLPEGYDYCDECCRLMITNYTWELYFTEMDGDRLCLPCAAQRYIENEDNWISLVPTIDLDQLRNMQFPPHIIGVEMPIPEGIKFFANVEIDSYSGGRIISSMDSEPNQMGTVTEILKDLAKARLSGYNKALLITDGAYQFACSLAIYVPDEDPGPPPEKGEIIHGLE